MKPALLALLACLPLAAQQDSAWKFSQELKAPAAGVYKHKLPPLALDAARPDLADLRLYGGNGAETPYLLEAARPAAPQPSRMQDFKSRMEGGRTVLTARCAAPGAMDAVLLETPAGSFIKPADIFVSRDGKNWRQEGRGVPLFRQYCNSENLRLDFAATGDRYVKVVVDDGRSAPVPFTGMTARVLPGRPAALETVEAKVTAREESGTLTRLTLRLPAANMFVFSLKPAVADKLYSRAVTVYDRRLSDGRVEQQAAASDVIFATDAAGTAASRTRVPVYAQFSSGEAVLEIENGNSPPLKIDSVLVEYAPVYLVFQAASAGTYRLAFGNRQAEARRYDLPSVAQYLTTRDFPAPQDGPVQRNRDYKEPEALPALGELGAAIDVKGWEHRAQVSVERRGVQELEIGPAVAAMSADDLGDLRLVSGGRQVPYILDRDFRVLDMPADAAAPAEKDGASVTRIKLPSRSFPLQRLTAAVPNGVFSRRVTLYEAEHGGGGEYSRRAAGSAVWSNDGHAGAAVYSISAYGRLSGDLELEVQNGDNSPLALSDIKLYYPVSRLVFKWTGSEDLWLYYGNKSAGRPSYDIAVAAQELLREEKRPARLEGQGGGDRDWSAFSLPSGLAKAGFWAALTAVAALLVFLIVKMLPPPAGGEGKKP